MVRTLADTLAPRPTPPPGPEPQDRPVEFVEVRLRGPSVEHWVHGLGARFDAKVQLRACRPIPGDPVRILRLFDVSARTEKIPAIQRFLRNPPSGHQVSLVAVTPHRLLVRVTAPAPAMCLAVFDVGGICTTCPFLTPFSGKDSWNVLVPDPADAQPLIRAFAAPGQPPATVVGVGSCRLPGELTARQEFALETAYTLGFFHQPRRATLKQVANALGVSRSTANELLHRGLLKIVARREGDGRLPVVQLVS